MLLLILDKHFPDATDQILHEADLGHIVGLQDAELFRQVVGVHILIAGKKQLATILAHHSKEAAPLVLDPDSVEILRLGADGDHDLGAVQSGKDIRLVFRAGLVLQGNPGEEDTVALLRELVVDFLGVDAVTGALLGLVVRLLVADKDVERFLVLRSSKNTALHLRNPGRILLILPPGDAVGVFQRCLVIHVLQEAVKAGAVAGGEVFKGIGVFYVFDAEAAERTAPVRLCVRVVLPDDALINRQRFVKLALPAEMVAPVEPRRPLIVRHLRQSHRRSSVLAGSKGLFLVQGNIPAAHLTFDDSHS